MTVYTAIIGNYDELKEPFVITPGWRYVVFTDQDIESKTWEIRRVSILDCGPAKTARYYKIMFNRHIQDEFSLWIDGTFFINCDLNEWWKHFKEPFTTVQHPFDRCIYTDIKSCIRGKKGDPNTLFEQEEYYKKIGVPKDNGLISSGILMRQNTPEVRAFCRLWWEQVEEFTERDQIAFGYVNYKMPDSHHSMTWDYTWQKEFIHIPHKHKSWSMQKFHETFDKYGSSKAN